jgi:hypothetical protein
LSNLTEADSCATKELLHITEWMQRTNSSLQAKWMEEGTKEKTLGAHINLIAGCPNGKPFWVENNKKLECFACDFSQKGTKSYEHLQKSC